MFRLPVERSDLRLQTASFAEGCEYVRRVARRTDSSPFTMELMLYFVDAPQCRRSSCCREQKINVLR